MEKVRRLRDSVFEIGNKMMSEENFEFVCAFCDILWYSKGDTVDTRHLAIALGRRFYNKDGIRSELETRRKSMRDMIVGTAVMFASVVLEMSVSMFRPLSEVAWYQEIGDTGPFSLCTWWSSVL